MLDRRYCLKKRQQAVSDLLLCRNKSHFCQGSSLFIPPEGSVASCSQGHTLETMYQPESKYTEGKKRREGLHAPAQRPPLSSHAFGTIQYLFYLKMFQVFFSHQSLVMRKLCSKSLPRYYPHSYATVAQKLNCLCFISWTPPFSSSFCGFCFIVLFSSASSRTLVN